MRRPLTMPMEKSARLPSDCNSTWRDSGSVTAAGLISKSTSVPSKSIRRTGRLSMGRACHAATALSTPRTEPRISRFDELAQGDGGVDQADVRVSLREISEQPPGFRLDVFGKQAHRICVPQQPIKQRCGIVEPPNHGEGLR